MIEEFLFYFALLGAVCFVTCYGVCRWLGDQRCLEWSMRLHLACAFALYVLICYQPQSAVSQAMRPSFETALAYAHYLLFGSPIS